ncbi:hypothetical protein GCM10010269_51140 [Streptomyces humidus]|uniref:Uncharacterized protein n=1 Tax=Streptomyces humidus TaxID=52259 RepID=A0A918L598_9ACTN|nr:hypothetical protein [Streptomyces humidus]GGS05952.1 hypothetical protein GCM10010269_51140 [Streptomyces humidus]
MSFTSTSFTSTRDRTRPTGLNRDVDDVRALVDPGAGLAGRPRSTSLEEGVRVHDSERPRAAGVLRGRSSTCRLAR